jgi:hypothetical protein
MIMAPRKIRLGEIRQEASEKRGLSGVECDRAALEELDRRLCEELEREHAALKEIDREIDRRLSEELPVDRRDALASARYAVVHALALPSARYAVVRALRLVRGDLNAAGRPPLERLLWTAQAALERLAAPQLEKGKGNRGKGKSNNPELLQSIANAQSFRRTKGLPDLSILALARSLKLPEKVVRLALEKCRDAAAMKPGPVFSEVQPEEPEQTSEMDFEPNTDQWIGDLHEKPGPREETPLRMPARKKAGRARRRRAP